MSRKAPQFSASDLLQDIEFEAIDGFAADDRAAAFAAFRRSAEIIDAKAQEQRGAVAPPPRSSPSRARRWAPSIILTASFRTGFARTSSRRRAS
ncbi:hypothetical protein [Methylocystis sp. SB2]|uniref:hypothetical protein n=1 Tax=Methylocystis sp. (strain SB2) TaxID=743836 RepID=UPI001EFA38E6|nr:hypothetical protein [Methylocystis sp. SB2]ULO22525.1 hypothetical protein LNB28_10005 [Methylocystis sp. SB2]